MGFESTFKGISSTLISVFAEEQGVCTYRARTSATGYNASTGVHAPKYTDYEILIVFDELEDTELMNLPNRAAHVKALISGGDLPVVPNKNDVIVDQNENSFKVVQVKTDNYGALFTVYVKGTNES